MSKKAALVFVLGLSGCTPQMAALAPSWTSQAANLVFQQERIEQQAELQREQQQQLYLQALRQNQRP